MKYSEGLYRQLTFKGSTRNVATKIYKNGMECFTRNVVTKIYKSGIEYLTNLSFYIQTMIRFHVQILVLYCHMEMFVKMMSVRWGIEILERKRNDVIEKTIVYRDFGSLLMSIYLCPYYIPCCYGDLVL